jgi:transcriptional regulator with XRE-family HTH domain
MAKSQHAQRYQLLPKMLVKLREQAGLTQRELATKLKMSQPRVHKSEVGERRVDVAEFMDWCLACGVEPEKMLRQLRDRRGL